MKTITKFAVAAAMTVGATSFASAQSFSPQVPNPANPAPANPIATDGTALPYSAVPAAGVRSGRSVGLADGIVGAPLGFAADTTDAAVGTAEGVADGVTEPFVR